jgi:hypothetical protein
MKTHHPPTIYDSNRRREVLLWVLTKSSKLNPLAVKAAAHVSDPSKMISLSGGPSSFISFLKNFECSILNRLCQFNVPDLLMVAHFVFYVPVYDLLARSLRKENGWSP